jgi:hypothetical protein
VRELLSAVRVTLDLAGGQAPLELEDGTKFYPPDALEGLLHALGQVSEGLDPDTIERRGQELAETDPEAVDFHTVPGSK